MLNTLHWGHVVVVAATMAVTNLFSQAEPVKPNAGAEHFRAKQILGSKVTIDSDLSIGTVDDIVLDENGNVDYLIVINKDQKLVTVPWDAVMLNAEKQIATVHITPEQFKKVPVYTTQQYPVFAAPTYRKQIYTYYGLTPAQERRVIRRGNVVVP